MRHFKFLSTVTHLILAAILLSSCTSVRPQRHGMITSESYISGLYNHDVDLNSAPEMFWYALSALDPEVLIYTGENNFYLQFSVAGRVVGGIISLAVKDRDQGNVGFSYIERNQNLGLPRFSKRAGGGAVFSAKDGVIVKKVDNFTYSVAFRGKRVLFRLYDPGMAPPKTAKLRDSEEYVGPVIDESGFMFFLCFDRRSNNLLLLLNDEHGEPDIFSNIGDDLVIGERSGFVFYQDRHFSRKILVGVWGENTLENNWWDGPHDQMPDNYIALGMIPKYQEYLERAYPGTHGRIDAFGNYLGKDSGRVAVAPYAVYFSIQELRNYIRGCHTNPESFYLCISRQSYSIPQSRMKRISRFD